MNNLNNIQESLQQIRMAEGEGFTCEEQAFEEMDVKNFSAKSSLTIKILTILGGILTSSFFLNFIFFYGLNRSGVAMVVVSLVFIYGAVWLTKVSAQLIIETVCISVFITGYFLICFGFDKLKISGNLSCFFVFVMAVSTLSHTKNYLLSFFSVLVISSSILSFMVLNKYYDFIHVYVSIVACVLTYYFLEEAKLITRYRKLVQLYNPVRLGLVFAFLLGLITLGKKGLFAFTPNLTWISSIAIIAMIFVLVKYILDKLQVPSQKERALIFLISGLILSLTALSPAIPGAILILLLSFLVNYKTGMVIGILSGIYFISQFYYDLNFSLLIKSILLFSSGVLFVLFYFFTDKKLAAHEKI